MNVQIRLLQPFYDEYEKCRLEDESEEREKKLKDLDAKLTYSSLGARALFQGNGSTIRKHFDPSGNKKYPEFITYKSFFLDVMAELWIEGIALEIMDGDAVHIPVEWLTAVLNQCRAQH